MNKKSRRVFFQQGLGLAGAMSITPLLMQSLQASEHHFDQNNGLSNF